MTSRKQTWISILLLVGLVLGLFSDVLFMPGDKVPSASYGDINYYFSTARSFGFGELAKGNLPLWNPMIFSGTPFVATFQSAMFYPPNLVYLVLPLSKAITVELSLHLFLFGFFTFLWARSRGIAPYAALFSAIVSMFCGSFFYRLVAGHATVIDAFAWMPLTLMAVDQLLQRPSFRWVLVGVLAVTLQWLAGMPQVVFITFVTIGILCVFHARSCIQRPMALGAVCLLAVLPILLAAVQLFTSFQAMEYSKSHGGNTFAFATSYSFPPGNFLSLIAPHAYGDYVNTFYWGAWCVWETGFFLGVTGLFLAIYGMLHGGRRTWPLVASIVALVVLALGSSTPVYEVLYRFVKPFSMFRAPTRFLVPASLLMALFCGYGLQALFEQRRRTRLFACVFLLLGVALFGGTEWVRHCCSAQDPASTGWARLMTAIRGDSLWANVDVSRAKDMNKLMCDAGTTLVSETQTAACICLALGSLIFFSRRYRTARVLIALLGVGELVFFAASIRSSFHLNGRISPQYRQEIAKAGSGRVLEDCYQLNRALLCGGLNVWGYEPMIQQRYVEFMARATHTQQPLDQAGRSPDFLDGGTLGPLLRVVRTEYYSYSSDTLTAIGYGKPPLREFYFVTKCTVAEHDKVLDVMEAEQFDPAWEAVVEESPVPAPDPLGKYPEVKVLERSTDHYVLEVNLPSPAVLINTDAYAPGWKVRASQGAPQQEYKVLAADYAVRAIPLAAGHYALRLEYAPSGYVVGKWVSLISLCVYAIAALWSALRQRARAAHDQRAPEALAA